MTERPTLESVEKALEWADGSSPMPNNTQLEPLSMALKTLAAAYRALEQELAEAEPWLKIAKMPIPCHAGGCKHLESARSALTLAQSELAASKERIEKYANWDEISAELEGAKTACANLREKVRLLEEKVRQLEKANG